MDPGTQGWCSPGGSGKPGAFSEAMKHGHNPGLKLLCCSVQSERHFIS